MNPFVPPVASLKDSSRAVIFVKVNGYARGFLRDFKCFIGEPADENTVVFLGDIVPYGKTLLGLYLIYYPGDLAVLGIVEKHLDGVPLKCRFFHCNV